MASIKWQLGEVIWFNKYSGEGEIRGEDGRDYFVHYSSIESKERWKKLKSDKKVKFQATASSTTNSLVKKVTGWSAE